MGNDAGRGGQVVPQRGDVQIVEQRAAADSRAARGRIHGDVVERRQIDHERTVGHGSPGPAMPSALDGEQQFTLPGEIHRVDDIRGRLCPHDQRRIPIVHSVPDPTSAVVAEIAIEKQLPGQAFGQFAYCGAFERRLFTAQLDDGNPGGDRPGVST